MNESNESGERVSEPGATFAWLFEAKAIQNYVFDSGQLRDLVGASDLVSCLARATADSDHEARGLIEASSELVTDHRDLIGRVRRAVVPDALPKALLAFSRRASGAFCLHSEDETLLQEIRALWWLAAQLRCPGLEMSEALSEKEVTQNAVGKARIESMSAAYKGGSGLRRNTAAELAPAGHPYTFFVPRTGRPSIGVVPYDEEPAYLDVLTKQHRLRASALRTSDNVAKRFLGINKADQEGRLHCFPRNLNSGKNEPDTFDNPKFPFRSDDTRIAVIHADVSGLGNIFQKATATLRDVKNVLELATAIELAIEAAAQAATAEVLLRRAVPATYEFKEEIAIIPARPVLLGGDDITILVRADLALSFTATLLIEIEKKTTNLLGQLRAKFDDTLPEWLSACAGVAIIKRGQPFLMAHALAASLCTYAKRRAKDGRNLLYPSAIAFHVSGSTMQEDYDDAILKNEMTANGIALTANPYWLGKRAPEEDATIDSLMALAAAIQRASGGSGKLRDLRRLVFDDMAAANTQWRRWWEVADPDNPAHEQASTALAMVRSELAKFGIERVLGTAEHEPPISFHHRGRTPLFDALDLIDLKTEFDASFPNFGRGHTP